MTYQPTEPMVEMQRFFAAPPSRKPSTVDAQSTAISRLLARCAEIRPHLECREVFERFVRDQPDPVRVRRRMSLALALNTPEEDLVYGVLGAMQLEAFRRLAIRKLGAVVWG